MEDMERYGDYNELDESPSQNPVTTVLKAVAVAVCFSVIVFLAFRIILFNYYPAEIKQLYFNDALTAYYNSVNGKIEVLTKDIDNPYDDADEGNFFCDNLLVIPGANQVQVSLRFNDAICEIFLEKYGVDIKELGFDAFAFTLLSDPADKDSENVVLSEDPEIITNSFLMYRYAKLVFDDVDFSFDDAARDSEWLVLEIELLGAAKETVFKVLLHKNFADSTKFDKYNPSGKEHP